ncbi:SCF ubiquitin ligase complex subunit cdc4, partial [Ascosphaera aggregata]
MAAATTSTSPDDPPGSSTDPHQPHHHQDFISDSIQSLSQFQYQYQSRSRPGSLNLATSCSLTATNQPLIDSTSSSSIADAGAGAAGSTFVMPFPSAPATAAEPAASTTVAATAVNSTTTSTSASISTSSKQRSCSKHVAGGNSKRQDLNSVAFILPPPSSHFRNSSHYPLANTTTPQHIRDFSFNVGDTSVRFREVDVNRHYPDSNVTYQLFTLPPSSNSELPQTSRTSTSSHPDPSRRYSGTPISLPEPPFPPPFAAAAAPLSASHPASANFLARPHALQQPRLPPQSHFADSPTDFTSHLVAEPSSYPQTTVGNSSNPSPPAANTSSFPLLLSPVPRRGSRNHVQFALANNDESGPPFAPVVQDHHTPISMVRSNQQGMLQVPAAPQIPATNHVDTATSSASASTTSNRPMMFRPSSINLSSEDVSLPSPRLSPVTATASRVADPSTSSSSSSSSSSTSNGGTGGDNSTVVVPTDELFDDLALQHLLFQSAAHQHHLQYSMKDIPVFVDFFESMPDKMKTYVMLQLLKRCPKTTLLPIAEAVNPALKVDFLGRLPLELSLSIIKHLDFRTMCRAACVSKKWRNLVNSDEKTWKSLFDQDGFVLAEGELERAIEE